MESRMDCYGKMLRIVRGRLVERLGKHDGKVKRREIEIEKHSREKGAKVHKSPAKRARRTPCESTPWIGSKGIRSRLPRDGWRVETTAAAAGQPCIRATGRRGRDRPIGSSKRESSPSCPTEPVAETTVIAKRQRRCCSIAKARRGR